MHSSNEVQEWLKQFNGSDKLLAKSFLNSLTLVSSTEFVEGLNNQIISISKKSSGKSALIPIRKVQKSKFRDENKAYRHQYSSADLIGYTLTELERSNIRSFIVEPTIQSMREEKIKNIILIDDIVGTGQRVIDFWKELDKSIKSWISYKKCKIWLVTYAAHETGLSSIIHTINPFTKENIGNQLVIETNGLSSQLQDLCIKYAERTSKPKAALGFGEKQNLVIFEFSCPNNSPAILWANGRDWKALFPNRSIPILLKKYFKVNQKMKQLNLVFDANQHELAMNILDAIEEQEINDEYFYILTILGFIQKGYKHKKLENLITLNKVELETLLKLCLKNKLIESKGFINKKYNLTIWGTDIIKRYKKNHVQNKLVKIDEKEISVYYPLQFKTVPAKI